MPGDSSILRGLACMTADHAEELVLAERLDKVVREFSNQIARRCDLRQECRQGDYWRLLELLHQLPRANRSGDADAIHDWQFDLHDDDVIRLRSKLIHDGRAVVGEVDYVIERRELKADQLTLVLLILPYQNSQTATPYQPPASTMGVFRTRIGIR